MAIVEYDIDNLPKVTQEMRDRVASMTDDEIDYSDMPAITDFSGFTRRSNSDIFGKRKKIELTIDTEIYDWLNHVEDVNSVLREVMVHSKMTVSHT